MSESSESDESDENDGGVPFAVSLAKTIDSQGKGIRVPVRNHKPAVNHRYESVILSLFFFPLLNLFIRNLAS